MKAEERRHLDVGAAIERIISSEDWKEYVEPLMVSETERLKRDAFNPKFREDHLAYISHAANYDAWARLSRLFARELSLAERLREINE